jgi:hypothetical protein
MRIALTLTLAMLTTASAYASEIDVYAMKNALTPETHEWINARL